MKKLIRHIYSLNNQIKKCKQSKSKMMIDKKNGFISLGHQSASQVKIVGDILMYNQDQILNVKEINFIRSY